jgi:hypothetical protein
VWWKYACNLPFICYNLYTVNATKEASNSQSYRWRRDYIEQRRKDRLSYVLLYKDLLKKNQSPGVKVTLDQLEEKLSAEDIVLYMLFN